VSSATLTSERHVPTSIEGSSGYTRWTELKIENNTSECRRKQRSSLRTLWMRGRRDLQPRQLHSCGVDPEASYKRVLSLLYSKSFVPARQNVVDGLDIHWNPSAIIESLLCFSGNVCAHIPSLLLVHYCKQEYRGFKRGVITYQL
jgi:hypothetical protein